MGPFIFLDIETTGFDPATAHIIEVACVKWENGRITDKYETLVNPQVPIPQEIAILTGISDKSVADAPRFAAVKDKIALFVADNPIVGHNIGFDTSFLRSHHMEITNKEIDTVALARILLKKEHSYALEVLMKKYKLPLQGSSHRAMTDTMAAVHFFEFLLEKINEIPPDAFKEMSAVLNKSEWPGKFVFADYKKTRATKNKTAIAKKTTIAKSGGIKKAWEKTTVDSFLNSGKILLESGAGVPFEELKTRGHDKLILVYSTNKMAGKLLNDAHAVGLTASHLKEPHMYFSAEALRQKLLQPNFTNTETPLLLKLIFWNALSDTGEREELSLEREEYPMFELFADNSGNDIYYQKALEEAKKSDVVLTHQYALAKGLADNIKGDRSLIITEACNLEDSFTNAFRTRFTAISLRPFFGEKSTMLFGLMGIFYEHFSSQDDFGMRGNVFLNESVRSSKQWQQVTDALGNLPEHPKKNELLKAFEPHKNYVSWVNWFADEVIFNSAPIFIADLLRERISGFKNIAMQSVALSDTGNFGLVRELFELDSSWLVIKGKADGWGKLNIEIPDGFPEPFNPGYFKKCLNLFMDIIEENKGGVLFLLGSKKSVEAFYQAMLVQTQKFGTKLLAVGPSGGMGKSLALFAENPAGSALITTNQILPFLDEIEEKINVVVFQKIPFDPPYDPVIQSRGKQFSNNFTDYCLPRAVCRFRELMNELNESATKQITCYILDSRLRSRDYGKKFLG